MSWLCSRRPELRVGSVLTVPGSPGVEDTGALDAAVKRAAQHENRWLEQLRALELTELPFGQRGVPGKPEWIRIESGLGTDPQSLVASFMLLLARLNNRLRCSIACLPRSSGAASPSLDGVFRTAGGTDCRFRTGDAMARV